MDAAAGPAAGRAPGTLTLVPGRPARGGRAARRPGHRRRLERQGRVPRNAAWASAGRCCCSAGWTAPNPSRRELYATALRLAENRDLVSPSGGDGAAPVAERRRAWRDELTALIDDLTAAPAGATGGRRIEERAREGTDPLPAQADRLRAIRAVPPGPDRSPYFDYDGTLIDGYSAGAFYRHRLRTRDIGAVELVRTVAAGLRGIRSNDDFGEFLDLTLAAWPGRPRRRCTSWADELFAAEIAGQLLPEVWELVAGAPARGPHASSSRPRPRRFQVQPMADELGVEHVLCTELRGARRGLTGRPAGTPLWGPGKAAAVVAARRGARHRPRPLLRLRQRHRGRAFLSSVGHPGRGLADRSLRALAAEQRLAGPATATPRGGLLPDVADVARTAVFYGGMLGGVRRRGGGRAAARLAARVRSTWPAASAPTSASALAGDRRRR